MEMHAIFQGFLVGIAIAFPKGPAGFLVITQTIQFGYTNGIRLAKGPIITTFISCLILIIISQWIIITSDQVQQIRGNHIMHTIAGFFLFAVGVYIIFFLEEKPATTQKLFIYTLFEPMLFPGTIATFMWIYPNIFQQSFVLKLYFFLGIIIGTFLYYGISVLFFSRYFQKINSEKIRKIHVFFGSVFVLFGFLTIIYANYKAVFF
jgi:uncharacterized membrane protein